MPRHNETAKVERNRQHESNHEFDRRRIILHTCRINASKVINSLCRRNFDDLQPVFYYVFDVMMLAGRDVMQEPLASRRKMLEKRILPRLREPIRLSPAPDVGLQDIPRSVREQGLEGLVAKRRDSIYEPGLRSGAWRKMRINLGQEFVIGGYTPSVRNFDALIFGYYDRGHLMYASRTRNGFTPALRDQLLRQMRGLEISDCPFVNLPEKKSGRWGQGLTAAKMKGCRWLLCRIRHSNHHVECRTMPYECCGWDSGGSLLADLPEYGPGSHTA